MTTDPAALLRGNDVAAALARLKQDIRAAPVDPKLRVFLFQLFCITADWDRALTQLTAAAELDPLAIPMAQTYRALIRCEILRERVFTGTTSPTLFGRPNPWMSLLVEANRLLGTGSPDQAARLRDAAFEQAPPSDGTLNDAAFSWIADADSRLGPMLEVIVDGRYLWVPFHRIAEVAIEPPADLRDQVWMPASFTWGNGGQAVGFIPTRYPGSATGGDAIALARRTEFVDRGDWSIPLGQRMFTTDEGDCALQDLRLLTVVAPAEPPEP